MKMPTRMSDGEFLTTVLIVLLSFRQSDFLPADRLMNRKLCLDFDSDMEVALNKIGEVSYFRD